jgi:hypothetical protein
MLESPKVSYVYRILTGYLVGAKRRESDRWLSAVCGEREDEEVTPKPIAQFLVYAWVFPFEGHSLPLEHLCHGAEIAFVRDYVEPLATCVRE